MGGGGGGGVGVGGGGGGEPATSWSPVGWCIRDRFNGPVINFTVILSYLQNREREKKKKKQNRIDKRK